MCPRQTLKDFSFLYNFLSHSNYRLITYKLPRLKKFYKLPLQIFRLLIFSWLACKASDSTPINLLHMYILIECCGRLLHHIFCIFLNPSTKNYFFILTLLNNNLLCTRILVELYENYVVFYKFWCFRRDRIYE